MGTIAISLVSSAQARARKARTYRASAMAAAARVDRSFFVLPFLLVIPIAIGILLGKQKKSDIDTYDL